MKTFLSLVFVLSAPAAFSSQVSPSKALLLTLSKARTCHLKISKIKYEFCTGFEISQHELASLWSSVDACKTAIEKLGYKTTSNNSEKRISEKDWQGFQFSTQSALTFHPERTVGFKKDNITNCMHEFVHVKQSMHAKDSDLSPSARVKLVRSLQASLETEVATIETYEKKGETKKALQLASEVQGTLDKMKQVSDLSQQLDEVEAHGFIYHECKTRICDAEDQETALVNLFTRKQWLPEAIKKDVETQVGKLLQQRKSIASAKAQKEWIPLPEEALSKNLKRWVSIDDTELITDLKNQGISIKKMTAAKKPPVQFGSSLSAEALQQLDDVTPEETVLLQSPKMLSGEAVGKFLCTDPSDKLAQTKEHRKLEGEKPKQKGLIVINPSSPKSTIIHEALHALQNELNPSYCEAVYGQAKIADEFAVGKISRAEHDEKLLYAQAINALAEKEVYTVLVKEKSNQSKAENLNNQEMLKHYQQWFRD